LPIILHHDDETIVAQCTPVGKGAIGLIRLSGTNAGSIVTRISRLASGKCIDEVSSHTIHYGTIVGADNNDIDHVLFLVMQGPKTFTGQNVIEISCHNNQFIIEGIVQAAIAAGARPATEGEFTRRAVLNNKMDLIQAEAINDLIGAQTQHSLKKALAQLDGSLSSCIAEIEHNLLKALALCEASFEFLDEEMSFVDQIEQIIHEILTTITQIKKTFDYQQQIRTGIRIALIGSVNAGKSSLFNALLGMERAIVTPIAGTTRDCIEASIRRKDTFWTLVDTAGLRLTDDEIEQEGIKRSWEQARLADIILLVYDAARPLSATEKYSYEQLAYQYHHKTIMVYNKTDLDIVHTPVSAIAVSAKNRYNLDSLYERIQEKITTLFESLDSPYLLNQRQFNSICGLEKKLQEVIIMVKNPHYELLSLHINDALAHLSELTGKAVSEQAMDAVFREFCVGK